eukprot:COSAG01_NODE_35098_length_537_cov_0.687215_1_plen_78_part_10
MRFFHFRLYNSLGAPVDVRGDLPTLKAIEPPPPSSLHPGATQAGGRRHDKRTPPWSPTADIHHGSGVWKHRRREGLFW